MRISYNPKNPLEKFGVKVYSVLVENFSETYYVGGMVRDLMLQRNVLDIDIATKAMPEEVHKILGSAGIDADMRYKNFGVAIAKHGELQTEVTTFRQDKSSAKQSRYPQVDFIDSIQGDSLRRDFTINALYLKGGTWDIADYHNGVKDIKNRSIRFIGDPTRRIKEDPLRIIRALRFQIQLNFALEKKTRDAIEKNIFLTNELSQSKIETEINKLQTTLQRKKVREIINSFRLTSIV